MSYSLRIIGHLPPDSTLKTSGNSVQMFTVFLRDAFREIGVDPKMTDIADLGNDDLGNPVDVVLAHTYHDAYTTQFIPRLKADPKICQITSSFMEVLFPTTVCFTFLRAMPFPIPGYPREVLIPAPCRLDLLPVRPKIPNSVLLDHDPSPPGPKNWTLAILDALEKHQDEFRTAEIGGEHHTPRPPIHRIPMTFFSDYVAATSEFETFIVTHLGSYNASVVDMLARGTRVMAPKDFVPAYNVQRFGILEFSSIDEMLSILRHPYQKDVWIEKRALCTDMKDAVHTMDAVFRELLNRA